MTSAANRQTREAGDTGQAGEPESALPPVLARVAAFVAIFIGAGAGGSIGHSFATMGGFGSTAVGLITFVAILLGAAGVAVVSVLTLRAFGEWETIRSKRS